MVLLYVLWVSSLLCISVSSKAPLGGSVIEYIKQVEYKTDVNTVKLNSLVKKLDEFDEKLPARRTWKLQAKNVCFGAKSKAYGKFIVKGEGRIVAMKFNHIYGGVTCCPTYTCPLTHWGCDQSRYRNNDKALFLYVTDQRNAVIYPKPGTGNLHSLNIAFQKNSMALIEVG